MVIFYSFYINCLIYSVDNYCDCAKILGNSIGTGSDDRSCKLFDIRCCAEVNNFGHIKVMSGVTSVQFSRYKFTSNLLFNSYH